MKVVWERHFDSISDAFLYIDGLPAQGLGGYAVFQLFRAKDRRVFIRCLRAKGRSVVG